MTPILKARGFLLSVIFISTHENIQQSTESHASGLGGHAGWRDWTQLTISTNPLHLIFIASKTLKYSKNGWTLSQLATQKLFLFASCSTFIAGHAAECCIASFYDKTACCLIKAPLQANVNTLCHAMWRRWWVITLIQTTLEHVDSLSLISSAAVTCSPMFSFFRCFEIINFRAWLLWCAHKLN